MPDTIVVADTAPLRLVAPAHYGYKSVKHLDRIELWRSDGTDAGTQLLADILPGPTGSLPPTGW